MPIVTPEIVVGISLLILFALIKFPLGVTTITIAHVAFCISFVVVVVLARLEGMDQNQRILKEQVDEEDIARIVSKWTGVPVTKMLESEVQKLIIGRAATGAFRWAARRKRVPPFA